jgi:lipopolysaccharide export LptBFGC system permease protein LptF
VSLTADWSRALLDQRKLRSYGGKMKARGLGLLLLAIWSIATGVLSLVPVLNSILAALKMSIVAIAAGVLILIRR